MFLRLVTACKKKRPAGDFTPPVGFIQASSNQFVPAAGDFSSDAGVAEP